jgi:uncharacterized protein
MRLNLREIIRIPGRSVPFDYELDLSDLTLGSVKSMKAPLFVSGTVRNTAGVLSLQAEVSADMVCVCARCLRAFDKKIQLHVSASLTDDEGEQDNPDVFVLDGDWLDVDEVIRTAFILSLEQRFFCREDCKGLCVTCGADLNEGPCICKADVDPRLAVLGQLLENE